MRRGDLTPIGGSYHGGPWMFTLTILTFRGDRIAHERLYFMEGWAAAEWRAVGRAVRPTGGHYTCGLARAGSIGSRCQGLGRASLARRDPRYRWSGCHGAPAMPITRPSPERAKTASARYGGHCVLR